MTAQLAILSAKSCPRDVGIRESMPSSGGFLGCCRGITNQVWIVFEQGTLRGEPFMRFGLVLLGACDLRLHSFGSGAARDVANAHEIFRIERPHPHFAPFPRSEERRVG